MPKKASAAIKNLFEVAHAAKENAYAPYSNHPVGSAIQTFNKRVFGGCNVETANYKGTCAEAGAIASMVSSGETKIKDIVVVGPGAHLCSPCGDCRQRIREFSDAATKIHIFDNDGNRLKSYTMNQLLPDSFGPENLKI